MTVQEALNTAFNTVIEWAGIIAESVPDWLEPSAWSILALGTTVLSICTKTGRNVISWLFNIIRAMIEWIWETRYGSWILIIIGSIAVIAIIILVIFKSCGA